MIRFSTAPFVACVGLLVAVAIAQQAPPVRPAGDDPQIKLRLNGLLAARTSADIAAAEAALIEAAERNDDVDDRVIAIVDAIESAGSVHKAALARVLGRLQGPIALCGLRQLAEEDERNLLDPSIDAAIREICSWPGDDVLDDLHALARTAREPRHRTMALARYIDVLAEPGPRSPDETAELLVNALSIARFLKSGEQVSQAIAALGDTPSPAAFDALLTHLDSPDTRDLAADALLSLAINLAAERPSDSQRAMQRLADLEHSASSPTTGGFASWMASADAFVTRWTFAGPYAASDARSDRVMAVPFPPESETRRRTGATASSRPAEHSVVWKRLARDRDGRPWHWDLASRVPDSGSCLYLRARLISERDQEVHLLPGGLGTALLWVNGHPLRPTPTVLNAEPVGSDWAARLRKGENTVLVKLAPHAGGLRFFCGIRSGSGRPVSGLVCR